MFEKRSDLIKFLGVVEAGKIHTAADKLNTTQPALSRTIAKLEEQFRCQLFERLTTGVRLTPVGAQIAEQARHILREIELAEAEIDSTVSGRTGNLRVSAGPIWMQAVLPSVVPQFHDKYPGIELRLFTTGYAQGIELLLNGETDLHCGAFDSEEPLPQFLKRQHVLDVTLGVLAHKDHPLHDKQRVTLDDLVDYPWLRYGTDARHLSGNDWPTLVSVHDALFEQTGRRVKTVIQCDYPGLQLMGTCPYLAYLPLGMAEDLAVTPLRRLPVSFGERTFRAGIIARRSIEGTSAFKHITEAIRQAAAKYRHAKQGFPNPAT